MFRFVLACSQTLYFLFKVRRARVIKNKNRGGFTDRQRKGFGVGEGENSLFFFLALRARSRQPMFSKRTKRIIKQRLCSGQFCSAVSFCLNNLPFADACWMSPLMKRKSILIVFAWKISVGLVKDVCVGGNSSEK